MCRPHQGSSLCLVTCIWQRYLDVCSIGLQESSGEYGTTVQWFRPGCAPPAWLEVWSRCYGRLIPGRCCIGACLLLCTWCASCSCQAMPTTQTSPILFARVPRGSANYCLHRLLQYYMLTQAVVYDVKRTAWLHVHSVGSVAQCCL
jgi:hypothetical protein